MQIRRMSIRRMSIRKGQASQEISRRGKRRIEGMKTCIEREEEYEGQGLGYMLMEYSEEGWNRKGEDGEHNGAVENWKMTRKGFSD
ncbi:MAG TPA: hypothetical protein VGN15_11100 [Ktedonobacteraceae bacterium]|jgi:hypothetical protein|nr:hypothetical protein [Ktedonobacteraceae bacterium]